MTADIHHLNELDAAWKAQKACAQQRDQQKQETTRWRRLNAQNGPLITAFERIASHVIRAHNGAPADVVMKDIEAEITSARRQVETIRRDQEGQG